MAVPWPLISLSSALVSWGRAVGSQYFQTVMLGVESSVLQVDTQVQRRSPRPHSGLQPRAKWDVHWTGNLAEWECSLLFLSSSYCYVAWRLVWVTGLWFTCHRPLVKFNRFSWVNVTPFVCLLRALKEITSIFRCLYFLIFTSCDSFTGEMIHGVPHILFQRHCLLFVFVSLFSSPIITTPFPFPTETHSSQPCAFIQLSL